MSHTPLTSVKVFGKVAGTVMTAGGKAMLACKKYSPELLLAGGIACGVAAVVTAVIATKKICEDAEVKELNSDLEAQEADIQAEIDKEKKKELKQGWWKIFWKLVKKFVRRYAIPVTLAILMALLCLKSHGILRGRYLETVAAYTALDNSYRDYRQRIRNIAGEEAEQRFFDGTDEIEIKEKDPETGKTIKKKVNKIKDGMSKRYSPYEFDFNPSTAPLVATGNREHDYNTLVQRQRYWQEVLDAQGYILMIDVVNDLGLPVRDPETKEFLIDSKLGWERGDTVGFGISNYYYSDDPIQEARSGNASHHLNMNAHMLPFLV